MEVNQVENFKSLSFEHNYDIIDVPGQGFYKTKRIETLAQSKIIILFLDSTDR
jgi:GTP-binding protein EngB required for normal cell division